MGYCSNLYFVASVQNVLTGFAMYKFIRAFIFEKKKIDVYFTKNDLLKIHERY